MSSRAADGGIDDMIMSIYGRLLDLLSAFIADGPPSDEDEEDDGDY